MTTTTTAPAETIPTTPAEAVEDLTITAPHCWADIPGAVVAIHGADHALELHEATCPGCLHEIALLERA